MDQDQIDAIAREIRKYYIEHKNAMYGGKFTLHSKYDFTYWQKAAVSCVEVEATPAAYVDAAFRCCTLSTGPYPNAMAGAAAKSWYNSQRSNAQDKARDNSFRHNRDVMFDENNSPHVISLRADIDLVNTSLMRLTGTSTINSKTIEYVNSFTTSFPAYVRVLLGHGNEKVKRFFGEEALHFYALHPGTVRAAEILGYPIRDILIWLNVPKS